MDIQKLLPKIFEQVVLLDNKLRESEYGARPVIYARVEPDQVSILVGEFSRLWTSLDNDESELTLEYLWNAYCRDILDLAHYLLPKSLQEIREKDPGADLAELKMIEQK